MDCIIDVAEPLRPAIAPCRRQRKQWRAVVSIPAMDAEMTRTAPRFKKKMTLPAISITKSAAGESGQGAWRSATPGSTSRLRVPAARSVAVPARHSRRRSRGNLPAGLV